MDTNSIVEVRRATNLKPLAINIDNVKAVRFLTNDHASVWFLGRKKPVYTCNSNQTISRAIEEAGKEICIIRETDESKLFVRRDYVSMVKPRKILGSEIEFVDGYYLSVNAENSLVIDAFTLPSRSGVLRAWHPKSDVTAEC
jgi:hypothetical protein